ncbi:transposase [Breznakiellaceae bacterium SP9]
MAIVATKSLGSKSLNFYYKIGTGYKPIRICALRKDEEGERKGMKHLKKSSDTGKVSERCELYNRYIIVATAFNAEISCEKILELYRTRWQIEIVFKRIKTLFHYDEVPIKKDEELAKAWFYSRLLFEAMGTSLVNQGRFSPSTE